MSAASENPTPACPQTALEACLPRAAPVAPLTAEERPPRPAKSALLPEIARLALAGYSGLRVPYRRAVPCPEDAPTAAATADPGAPVPPESGHNPA